MPSRAGVLALQGDFAQHISLLHSLDVECFEVRSRNDLEGIDALVIPGGESTTIAKALVREKLIDPIREFAQSGL
ncbi:MAG: pyridoxal 5'-phosphate synthase glutaminase subunit PdxT, partial [Solirubrobacterales bacterium]|nr:pyridoxal 5'-phosphate synthase glutaminase subunit PdxT [Solirubrobacterales bacterium]